MPMTVQVDSTVTVTSDPAVCVFIMCVCLLLQYLLQSCSRGGRGIVEDMCYETTSRGLKAWTSLPITH